MPMREYLCPVGHVFEELRPLDDDARELRCPEHALYSDRQASRTVQLNPPTGAALRSQFQLYQEATQEIDRAYTRAEAVEERPIESPNLWLEAKASAKAITDAGEAPTLTSPFQ